jgi:MFS family permease
MSSWKSLPRNARTCIPLEPLWSLFGPMVTYFMPLYQRELGMNEVQMGLVNSVNIAAGLLFYSLASPISNKLGRRKTSMAFDFVAWSLSMLIWAFAKSFAWFLVAAVTNAVVRIVIVSWNLLISEDATETQRATIFGWINVIGTFGGFTTFAGGLLIAGAGLVPAMRVIFIVGAIVMTAMFIVRFIGTRETQAGVLLREKTKHEGFLRLVAQQLPKAGQSLKDIFFLKMTGLYFIANAVLSIDFFRILYLTEEKRLSSFAVSAIPAVSAIASIFLFFVVLPRLKPAAEKSRLSNSFLLCALTQALFIAMPKGSALSAILVFPALQAAYALLQTFRDTVFMNGTDPEHKSERFSLIQALMLLFSIPMGWFSGLLYTVSPHLPFILASLLYFLGFLLAKSLGRDARK